jgi:hypothetical protein
VLDPNGLAAALTDLATARACAPEEMVGNAARSQCAYDNRHAETTGGSRREIEEVIEWKIERTFGAPLDELRIGREELAANEQKQARYLITAVRAAIMRNMNQFWRRWDGTQD